MLLRFQTMLARVETMLAHFKTMLCSSHGKSACFIATRTMKDTKIARIEVRTAYIRSSAGSLKRSERFVAGEERCHEMLQRSL